MDCNHFKWLRYSGKNSMKASIYFTLLTIFLFSFDLPSPWFKAGTDKDSYDMGIDKASGRDGKDAATIKSIKPKIKTFGTLMQDANPEDYLGKRIRMTGYVKSSDAELAGLWLRIDGAIPREVPLSFDNMIDRGIRGTTDWTKYEIVLDVPNNATNMAFGALLEGTGQIWFDDIKFEIVDLNVPTTGRKNNHFNTIQKPDNLNFEK